MSTLPANSLHERIAKIIYEKWVLDTDNKSMPNARAAATDVIVTVLETAVQSVEHIASPVWTSTGLGQLSRGLLASAVYTTAKKDAVDAINKLKSNNGIL